MRSVSQGEVMNYDRNWNLAKDFVSRLKLEGLESKDIRQIVKMARMIAHNKITPKIVKPKEDKK